MVYLVPFLSFPDSSRNIAPIKSIEPLSADLIWVVTGMIDLVDSPSLAKRFLPAKQLIHPVSAVASMIAECRGCAWIVFNDDVWLISSALTYRLSVGCAWALSLLHVLLLLLYL